MHAASKHSVNVMLVASGHALSDKRLPVESDGAAAAHGRHRSGVHWPRVRPDFHALRLSSHHPRSHKVHSVVKLCCESCFSQGCAERELDETSTFR